MEHFREIFAFFGKTTPYDKIFKILFGKFTSRHQSPLLCAKFVKIVRREIGEIMRYSCDQQKEQNFGSLSNCCYCANRAHGQPPTSGSQRSKFHPKRFTFGGVIAGRVKAVKTRLSLSNTRRSYSFSPSNKISWNIIIIISYNRVYYNEIWLIVSRGSR